MIDKQLFETLQEVYKNNIEDFKKQNTGLSIENIKQLEESEVERVIKRALNITEDMNIDINFIKQHFNGFTINPTITEFIRVYTISVVISPDIAWISKK